MFKLKNCLSSSCNNFLTACRSLNRTLLLNFSPPGGAGLHLHLVQVPVDGQGGHQGWGRGGKSGGHHQRNNRGQHPRDNGAMMSCWFCLVKWQSLPDTINQTIPYLSSQLLVWMNIMLPGDFRMGQLKLSLPPSCLNWLPNPNEPAYECVRQV